MTIRKTHYLNVCLITVIISYDSVHIFQLQMFNMRYITSVLLKHHLQRLILVVPINMLRLFSTKSDP
jgi:hypothetical protein